MSPELALISVSDKNGVTDLAGFLRERGVEILSTGGTAKTIREADIPVTEVAEYTGFPESPDGLVKTLHPKVHGGWLMNNPQNHNYVSYCVSNEIRPIDYVVVNLYPFETYVLQNPDCTLEEAMAQMDIGGPAMIRGAAKAALKYGTTTVLCEPNKYESFMNEFITLGKVDEHTRRSFALAAIELTRDYDSAIADFVTKKLEEK